ncbi:MAG: ATP-grasp domain-containing protein [Gemmatimonadales bacterium]
MIVAIHRDTSYEDRYGDAWAGCLRARGAEVRLVDLTARDALAQVAGSDGVMWRWGHLPEDKLVAPRVLHAIELVHDIPVFPDHATGWHYDDKLAQFSLLAGAGFPMPPTWIFSDLSSAKRWAVEANYPKIFKLSAGASGLNVVLVHSEHEAIGLIDRMFGYGIYGGTIAPPPPGRRGGVLRKLLDRPPAPPPEAAPSGWTHERGYAYFQEWVPDNPFDTRVIIIGERAWAYRRYPHPGDFRASRAGGPRDYDPEKIDRRAVRLGFEMSRRFGFQCMAYDMMLVRGEPVVLELSYTFGFLSHDCPGYWTPALEWIPGQMWPYEAQIEDFMRTIAARRPAPR